jgi:hypothetical protein
MESENTLVRKEVALDNFDPSSELVSAKRFRFKVAAIEVTAPRKGAKLFANGFRRSRYVPQNQSAGYATTVHGAEYYLKHDAGGMVRKAMAFAFEVDRSSDRIANVDLALEVQSRYYTGDLFCSYWDLRTTAVLSLSIKNGDRVMKMDPYNSVVKKSVCDTWGKSFVDAAEVSTTIAKALDLSARSLIKDLRKLRQADGALTPTVNVTSVQ